MGSEAGRGVKDVARPEPQRVRGEPVRCCKCEYIMNSGLCVCAQSICDEEARRIEV